MKIFIFKTSKYWSWAGGGLVVKAENWEDLNEIVKAYFDKKESKSGYKTKFTLNKKELIDEVEEDDNDNWVLVDSFELKGKHKSCVVLCDYNVG